MKHVLTALIVFLAARAAIADEVKVQYRLTGLFQPDRVDDLRRQAGTLVIKDNNAPAEVKLVDVDYEAAVVTFAYDADSSQFKNKSPEQVHERINSLLRTVSRGSFQIFPRSPLKPEQLKQERIAVAGLDCKGCAYGAYRVIATIDGVERAIVSFKDGHVTAWIDPTQTNRTALVAALQKAQVDVIDPPTGAETPQKEQ